MRGSAGPEADALWYKDAIVYELHVRSFFDSNGDGIGDFRGLVDKLDYLHDLGVTALWLLPFYPSPLKDDGYDISDYVGVNRMYGSLADVRLFIREAHRRGLRVITELVCNHTSDQHPWFQRARRDAPGSSAREFYVWSDSPDRYPEARIIFRDFEPSNWTWDPVAKAYYWHRFYSHQPDLNYDHPAVQRAILRVLDFWLEAGVDGVRLDAVPYLFERDGTNCENLAETHAFLKQLRAHVDSRFTGRMVLAEANQWPEEAAAYFGDGDECHVCFHFPLMPRLFMSMRMEDRFPIVDILQQTPAIPPNSQWGIFLRNHDELTLEMVTDEERDYMYRAYSLDPEARINLGIRRRLAPLLGNSRRRIELMNGLLFSLPGTPFLYYGDEIGMGDNIFLGDRDGVRAPMQWSDDRNAGFSRANRQRLFLPAIVDPEYHYEAVNVETQAANPQSLLSWMKRLIALRKRHSAFGRGSFEFLHPDNRKTLAFIRRTEQERVLVVANLSRFVQPLTLDLSAFRGCAPVELFGGTVFPPIGDAPYVLTLGPHSFYWFALEPAAPAARLAEPAEMPALSLGARWDEPPTDRARRALAERLAEYVRPRRWFASKTRRIRSAAIREIVPLGPPSRRVHVAFLELTYAEGEAETYLVPLGRVAPDRAAHAPHAVIALLSGDERVLVDATADPDLGPLLLDAIARRRRFRGGSGALSAEPTRVFAALRPAAGEEIGATLAQVEQSNNSLVFGERLMLKLFRRLEPGLNPELEIGRALTDARFPNIAELAGSIEYRPDKGEPLTVAVLQRYVPSEGDAWSVALRAFDAFAERIAGLAPPSVAGSRAEPLLALSDEQTPGQIEDLTGGFLAQAELLGRRTAELHLALAAVADPAFTPEPFTQLDRRSVYQAMRAMGARALAALREQLRRLPEDAREDAAALLEVEARLEDRFRPLRARAIELRRIRTHGDLHLGQVLVTGGDFVFIDFEGEPARSIADRRLKRAALRDVAGMLRSFAYAAEAGRQAVPSADLGGWTGVWASHVSARYMRAYLAGVAGSGLVPAAREDLGALLDAFLLEKALYELLYELNNRPERVGVPLAGLRQLLS